MNGSEVVKVVLNFGSPVDVKVSGEVLMSSGFANGKLERFGVLVEQK